MLPEVLVFSWFGIVSKKLLHILHCSFEVYHSFVFLISLRRQVCQVIMHKDLCRFESILWLVAAHPFKQIFEFLRWFDLLEYLPEPLFIFVSEPLVIRIFRMSTSEWLKLHCHEEQSRCCCKNVSFNAIVPPWLLSHCFVFLNGFTLSFLYFPELRCIVGLRSYREISLHNAFELLLATRVKFLLGLFSSIFELLILNVFMLVLLLLMLIILDWIQTCSKVKVSYNQLVIFIDQQVLWLNISMYNAFWV